MVQFLKEKMQGQMSILATIIVAGSTVIASALGAYATSSNSYAELKETVSVNQRTEELHYQELKESVDKMDNKLDRLLERK